MQRYHETPLPVAGGLCFALAVSLVQAQGHADLPGRSRVTCTPCHGATGNAGQATVPTLAGQHVRYLIKQLRDFRSGARNNAVMGPSRRRSTVPPSSASRPIMRASGPIPGRPIRSW